MQADERLRTLRAIEGILEQDGYSPNHELRALVNDLLVEVLEEVTSKAASEPMISPFCVELASVDNGSNETEASGT